MRCLVLIIGNRIDPHVERVMASLAERGCTCHVIDPFATEPSLISYRFAGSNLTIRIDDSYAEFPIDDVTAVWWRLKPAVVQPGLTTLDSISQGFAEREWQHTLESLEEFIPASVWINPRSSDRRIRYKPKQLLWAARAGFSIPPTLISNDAEEIACFLHESGDDAIYKPLSWYFRPPSKLLFTSGISAEMIESSSASLRIAPGIFQQRLGKAYELRITIVGDKIFPARIDSQQHPESALDWRRRQNECTYCATTLPVDLAERLITFHRALGLVFGAYDFVVTPAGDHVFLEVNPVGQWLWLEDATGLPISEAMTIALMSQ